VSRGIGQDASGDGRGELNDAANPGMAIRALGVEKATEGRDREGTTEHAWLGVLRSQEP
jgi:hypothetical protein